MRRREEVAGSRPTILGAQLPDLGPGKLTWPEQQPQAPSPGPLFQQLGPCWTWGNAPGHEAGLPPPAKMASHPGGEATYPQTTLACHGPCVVRP